LEEAFCDVEDFCERRLDSYDSDLALKPPTLSSNLFSSSVP
jgi:hypothetical protein